MHRISRGLDLPLAGEPEQEISDAPDVRSVALIGFDYVGMKPTMEVNEGDSVKLGQTLFTDKKTPGVRYTSPGSGTVAAVNRGAKRVFQSLVIDLEGDDEETFTSYENRDLTTLGRDAVRDLLVESGAWTSFRTRPYNKVPDPQTAPHSIFVTAIDTRPLAADPAVVIKESPDAFVHGLQVVRQLTDGPTWLCRADDVTLPGEDVEGVRVEEFTGKHPAGLPGTHIHRLDPVSERKTVWFLNYQDVIAVGRLFTTGRVSVERVVSLAGPSVQEPRLLRTRLGANLSELVAGQLHEGDPRVVSGSVLCGRKAEPPFDFLGRYHLQVSALPEGTEREFLGWQGPGFDRFSVKRLFASGFLGNGRKYALDTSTHGSPRAMVPVEAYEDVMPLDLEPTFLLRSLIVQDTERARALGALELDEEDLSLCTFVCPGKYDYGPLLRKNLDTIEREG